MSKSANNKGRRHTSGRGTRKSNRQRKTEIKSGNAKAKRQRKKASEKKKASGGAGSRGSYHKYDSQEKIDELERDANDFIYQRDVLKKKISVPTFLVGKPHADSTFAMYVGKDASKRRALPTLDNDKNGVSKGQTKAISAKEEKEFIQENKDVDTTLNKAKSSMKKDSDESFADVNPLMFAFESKFPHVTGEAKRSKVSKIRKKIRKLQEKERAAIAAAAAIAPLVSNDADDEEEEIY